MSYTKNQMTCIIAKTKIPRKFEIFVEEYDEDGPNHKPWWRPVKIDPSLGGTGGNPVITVSSQKELNEKHQLYQQIGQRFKVLREIDPPTDEQILELAKQQGVDIGAICRTESDPDDIPSAESNAPETAVKQAQPASHSAECRQSREIASTPKIIKIGDIQIKYDGDKVYQKQWVRLTEAESANFRILNTNTNKIIPMNGKHIEAKKWVLAQQSDEQDETQELFND